MTNKNRERLVNIFKDITRNMLLIVNILFAIFYLFVVLSNFVSPSITTFFAYFGLLSPIIIIANLFFVVLWIIRKRKYWLISAIILTITYFHVNQFFTIPFQRLCKKPFDKEIKMLSYNISSLGSVKNFYHFMDFIKQTDADIVCFQEFGYYSKDKNRLKKAMESIYPYSHIWYKSQSKNFSWGVATFSKFPIIGKEKVQYESKYNVSIYSDIVIDKDTIRFVNNHLESNKFTLSDIRQYKSLNDDFSKNNIMFITSLFSRKLGQAYRIRASQAVIVRNLIDHSPYRVVVCGDFNDVTESYVYHKIKSNLIDLYTATSWGYRYSFRTNFMLVGIDHILLDRGFVPLSSNIGRQKFSDHYPLIGTFGIRENF